MKYHLKTGSKYWKPLALGYTQSKSEAGVFTLEWLLSEHINLDGVTLEIIR